MLALKSLRMAEGFMRTLPCWNDGWIGCLTLYAGSESLDAGVLCISRIRTLHSRCCATTRSIMGSLDSTELRSGSENRQAAGSKLVLEPGAHGARHPRMGHIVRRR